MKLSNRVALAGSVVASGAAIAAAAAGIATASAAPVTTAEQSGAPVVPANAIGIPQYGKGALNAGDLNSKVPLEHHYCGRFHIVKNDPGVHLRKGHYHWLVFGEGNTCADSVRFLDGDPFGTGYLYKPYPEHWNLPLDWKGYTVEKTPFKNSDGNRFIKEGTDGKVGFDLWIKKS